MSAQDRSFYSDVIRYFDQAAAFTQHPSGLLDQIKRCNSVYRFEFPLSQPAGDVEVINAGGVTVSYFEWLKNLSHVRFGRMEKRYEEAVGRRMLKAMELSTGHRFTEPELDLITRGANELDIVNSGLEETMVTAYHEILETRRQYPGMQSLRAAAFFNAIEKVARTYMELGIFP